MIAAHKSADSVFFSFSPILFCVNRALFFFVLTILKRTMFWGSSSNHSDQSVVMAEVGATASPKSSRAKRMQRWSTKLKESVAEEFA